ncbi:MAG: hypothetical protein R6W72_04500 [Desulfurivibrionaceae bacterium]
MEAAGYLFLIFLHMPEVSAVVAMEYLAFFCNRFRKHVGTGGGGWFDIPTVPFFLFIKHAAFTFGTFKKLVTFDSHIVSVKNDGVTFSHPILYYRA